MPSAINSEPAKRAYHGTSRPSGLEAAFVRAVRFLVSMPRRQAVKNELNRLSDRELADIGLNRTDIALVYSRSR